MLNQTIFIKIIKILLFPFSILYGIIIDIRNLLYDWGMLKSCSFPVPVISIGNITLGGTGKTPFTIFLAKKLQNQFKQIAVVSRGYGRQSRGLQIVSDGKEVKCKPALAGDEPYLIARSLPGVIVAVSENRIEALQFIIDHYQVDLIILDDAFQRRSVKRDIDIVLLNARQPFKYNLPLPSGTLREFQHNLSRADIILHTNVDEANKSHCIKFKPDLQFTSKTKLGSLMDLDFKPAGKISGLPVKKAYAFAGIAHPENFKKALLKEGLEIINFKMFKDHHSYTLKDMQMISKACLQKKCSLIICTEKDLVKIQEFEHSQLPFFEHDQKIYGATLDFIVEDEERLIKTVTDFDPPLKKSP